MDITLSKCAEAAEILSALMRCSPEDAVCCVEEDTFKRAKILLLKEKLKDVTIQLLDADGYAIRQVSSKPKSDQEDQLNARQRAVIKALEKVLMHCKKEGVQLVGYSDELVAIPASVKLEESAYAGAMDVNCFGVYKGADAIISDEI